jgi:hypothetical protein
MGKASSLDAQHLGELLEVQTGDHLGNQGYSIVSCGSIEVILNANVVVVVGIVIVPRNVDIVIPVPFG